MSTPEMQAMSSEDRAAFTAMTERMRQLRRRHGIPNGVSLTEAVALHFLSDDDIARARWGNPDVPPLLAAASQG